MAPPLYSSAATSLPESLLPLKIFLICTFLLHLIPVNLITGCSLLAAISVSAGRKNPHHIDLSRLLASFIPYFIRLTVVIIVAVIIITEIFYGQYFSFTVFISSAAWTLTLVLLVLGYFGTYYLQGKLERRDQSHVISAWIIALIFVFAGVVYSHNFPLMLRPESWSMYTDSSLSAFPDWTHHVLYPGIFHMVIGAVALSGLWIMIIGIRKKSGTGEWSLWAVQYGGKMFSHATLLNIVIGVWFIFALPLYDMKKFLGANMTATPSAIGAFFLTVAALFIIFKARNTEDNRRLVYTGTVLIVLVLLLMAIMRQQF